MKEYNIEIVVDLGDRVAFKKDMIYLRQSFFATIPEVHRESLKSILNLARKEFETLMQEDRNQGLRVRARHHKKTALSNILDPWLVRVGAGEEDKGIKVHKSKKPRIPKKAKCDIEAVVVDVEAAAKKYNTFISDRLEDDMPGNLEIDDPDIEVVGIEFDDGFNFDKDVFEGLSKEDYL